MNLRLPFLACTLAFGCSTSSPARAAEPATQEVPGVAPPARPATIRFGDSAREIDLAPFFAGTVYDPRVPKPDTLLRQPLGTFTAHHAEILAGLRAIEAHSPRVKVVPFGRTHEGRELVYAVIASPENLASLERIRADLGRLADPRGLEEAEGERIVERSPAVAWLGYSIHGDEMSGADASLAVAYHLAAGTSTDVTDLLRSVVVVVDPMLNPDGRERILSQLEQSAGYVPNLDVDSMHRGRWPFGRGNHYLFDMNRDWLFGTQPETRARWSAIRSFYPQLLVDAHEMSGLDTFLFYPATDPFTPHFPEMTKTWWQRFGADQASAFDLRGWSYYTREWADSWYPGYSDSWGSFIGAVGILYEQARFHGQSIRRASGEIVTYREAVERQAASSIANVATLATNRASILRDYLAAKRKNVAADTPGNERMFVLVPGRNADREARFVSMLTGQGIEVSRASTAFTGKNVETTLAGRSDEKVFPAGSLVVSTRQPLSSMVKAYLAFDPRYDKASLDRERKELERKQRSKSYDVTAWSPAHGFDLDAHWCDTQEVAAEPIRELPERERGVVSLANAAEPIYGWVVDGNDDVSVVFAARAMELGLQIELCDEPFTASGRSFARGSLLVRRHENVSDAGAKVSQAAIAAGVQAFATGTARSSGEGPDLGGQHFRLLARPRVALLSNSPVSTDSFGHAWHLLDAEIGLPCTLIDAQSFGDYDLRRYNVLVVPEAGGDLSGILKENAESLRAWIENGGTLIASGESAAALADEELGLSGVRLRQDVLKDLDAIAVAVRREREAGRTQVDEAALWNEKPAPLEKSTSDEAVKEPEKPSEKSPRDSKDKQDEKPKTDDEEGDLERLDRWKRTFSPHGVILRAEINPDVWLTAGCRDELPVFFDGSNVLVSQLPVRTPVRFAAADRLRLGGLLWPEARARIADSAYCTIESKGAGQVILFATPPDFRGWFPGTSRLLANAVVYGPGAGARQPSAW